MAKQSWSPKQVAMLKKEYPRAKDPRDLAKKLRKSYTALKSKVNVLKLKRQVRANDPWTPLRKTKMAELYSNTLNAVLAKRFNVTEGAVSAMAYKMGLRKTDEFKLRHNMATCFKKGSVPANKGKKMSKELYEKARPTMFKKGNIPHNVRGFKDGDISIRYDHKERGGRAYKYLRVSLGKWVPLHKYNWEKANGPMPKKHCLRFRDEDPMNCDLSNLELITMAENAKRNSGSLHLADGYIAKVIVGKYKNPELFAEVLKNKKLLEAKRQQLILNRTINERSTNTN